MVTTRNPSTAESEAFEAQIEGETLQWEPEFSYARHLQVDKILSAQAPVSDKPAEMLFIITHQTMELWLKLLLHETRLVVDALRQGALPEACRLLDRLATILRHMINAWEVMATLTPNDFLAFRSALGKASGLQSQQYREFEFLLGSKRGDFIAMFEGDPNAAARLDAALRAPSLYDEVLALLARRGLAIPAELLDRDWSQPYVPSIAVEDAWLAVYSDIERFWDIHLLGEKMTALEACFQEWRFKHLKTVERVIGLARGTGGSSGVGYLAKGVDISAFPELWSVRTRLSSAGHGSGH